MTDWFVVVAYDRVDVHTYQSTEPEYVPGEPSAAKVVQASTEDEAIGRVADAPGFYSAHSFDPRGPREFSLVETGRG